MEVLQKVTPHSLQVEVPYERQKWTEIKLVSEQSKNQGFKIKTTCLNQCFSKWIHQVLRMRALRYLDLNYLFFLFDEILNGRDMACKLFVIDSSDLRYIVILSPTRLS